MKLKPIIIPTSDSEILEREKELLSNEMTRSKNSEGHWVSGEKLTLYCVLALAAMESNGKFDINATYSRAVMLKITSQFAPRLDIQDNRKYWNRSLLLTFNNHQFT